MLEQNMDLALLNKDDVKDRKNEVTAEREKELKLELENICHVLDEKAERLLKAACEKGSSSWLSALPLKKMGYSLNKQDFRDAIALRYGWNVPGMPNFCGCGGKPNSMDHILTCKKGGFVSMRHNVLRNTEARLMENVCKDVKIEPELLPVQGEQIQGNTAEKARLDVSARGVWGLQEKTFFDIRVFHPNADSNLNKTLDALYVENENQKKRAYNERVVQVEKASFTPLVFSTAGGMGKECHILNKRLAELIALKNGEIYSQVITHIRTRLRFALLKATVVAVRGVRGRVVNGEQDIDMISFNLIPHENCIE